MKHTDLSLEDVCPRAGKIRDETCREKFIRIRYSNDISRCVDELNKARRGLAALNILAPRVQDLEDIDCDLKSIMQNLDSVVIPNPNQFKDFFLESPSLVEHVADPNFFKIKRFSSANNSFLVKPAFSLEKIELSKAMYAYYSFSTKLIFLFLEMAHLEYWAIRFYSGLGYVKVAVKIWRYLAKRYPSLKEQLDALHLVITHTSLTGLGILRTNSHEDCGCTFQIRVVIKSCSDLLHIYSLFEKDDPLSDLKENCSIGSMFDSLVISSTEGDLENKIVSRQLAITMLSALLEKNAELAERRKDSSTEEENDMDTVAQACKATEPAFIAYGDQYLLAAKRYIVGCNFSLSSCDEKFSSCRIRVEEAVEFFTECEKTLRMVPYKEFESDGRYKPLFQLLMTARTLLNLRRLVYTIHLLTPEEKVQHFITLRNLENVDLPKEKLLDDQTRNKLLAAAALVHVYLGRDARELMGFKGKKYSKRLRAGLQEAKRLAETLLLEEANSLFCRNMISDFAERWNDDCEPGQEKPSFLLERSLLLLQGLAPLACLSRGGQLTAPIEHEDTSSTQSVLAGEVVRDKEVASDEDKRGEGEDERKCGENEDGKGGEGVGKGEDEGCEDVGGKGGDAGGRGGEDAGGKGGEDAGGKGGEDEGGKGGEDEGGKGGADDDKGGEDDGKGGEDEGGKGCEDKGGKGDEDKGGRGGEDKGGRGGEEEGGRGGEDEGGRGGEDEGGRGGEDEGGRGGEDEEGIGGEDEEGKGGEDKGGKGGEDAGGKEGEDAGGKGGEDAGGKGGEDAGGKGGEDAGGKGGEDAGGKGGEDAGGKGGEDAGGKGGEDAGGKGGEDAGGKGGEDAGGKGGADDDKGGEDDGKGGKDEGGKGGEDAGGKRGKDAGGKGCGDEIGKGGEDDGGLCSEDKGGLCGKDKGSKCGKTKDEVEGVDQEVVGGVEDVGVEEGGEDYGEKGGGKEGGKDCGKDEGGTGGGKDKRSKGDDGGGGEDGGLEGGEDKRGEGDGKNEGGKGGGKDGRGNCDDSKYKGGNGGGKDERDQCGGRSGGNEEGTVSGVYDGGQGAGKKGGKGGSEKGSKCVNEKRDNCGGEDTGGKGAGENAGGKGAGKAKGTKGGGEAKGGRGGGEAKKSKGGGEDEGGKEGDRDEEGKGGGKDEEGKGGGKDEGGKGGGKDEGGKGGGKDEGGKSGGKDEGGEDGGKDEGGKDGGKDEGGKDGGKDEGGKGGGKDEGGKSGDQDEGGKGGDEDDGDIPTATTESEIGSSLVEEYSDRFFKSPRVQERPTLEELYRVYVGSKITERVENTLVLRGTDKWSELKEIARKHLKKLYHGIIQPGSEKMDAAAYENRGQLTDAAKLLESLKILQDVTADESEVLSHLSKVADILRIKTEFDVKDDP